MKIDLTRYSPPVYFVVTIWVVEIINLFTGHSFNEYGILPRTPSGLIGIPISPILHSGLLHTLSNTLPLLILGGLVIFTSPRKFWSLTVLIALIGGMLTWLFGRHGYHVGSSGIIFGYFGYLLATAYWTRDVRSIVIALVVVFLYGGLIWGILPAGRSVSFEAHLFGFITGIVLAWSGSPRKARPAR